MKKSLMTIIAILGLSTITMAQLPSYVPSNGLVGWWGLNGNANDESVNGNNGTIMGNVITGLDRFGNSNSAYVWQSGSSNDYIDIGNINSQLTNKITLSVWVLLDCSVPDQRIIGTGEQGLIVYQIQGSNVRLKVSYDPAGQIWPSSYWMSRNNWHHLVFTADNSLNFSKFYVDGILTDSTNGTSGNQSNVPWNIGRKSIPGFDGFCGKIDDLGIWNRALTKQEISDLYAGCLPSVNLQPSSTTINISDNAQFVVGSSDSSATFQWQTDLGVGFQNLNNVVQYSGTTDDTLVVSNVTMNNNNQPFRCIVFSGTCADTSNVAVLTVVNNVNIDELNQDNFFTVFPNPTQNVLNFKADSKFIGESYLIKDINGRLVLSGKVEEEFSTIDLNTLAGGIYLFSIGENTRQTVKLVKIP